MADEVTLHYGDGAIRFKKSDSFVAVKLKPGTQERSMLNLVPQLFEPQDTQAELGGFHIYNVKNAPGSDTNTALDMLRASGAVDVGTHVYETSDDHVPFVPTGQLYIECKENAQDADIQDLLDQHHLQVMEVRGPREFIVRVTPESENPVKTAAALQQSPLVEVAEPDMATPGIVKASSAERAVHRHFTMPNDALLQEQWHLRNRGRHRGTTVGFLEGADARVFEAWKFAKTMGSPNVIIAIIDDGFDLAHPDLSGRNKIVAPRDFTRNSDAPLPDLMGEDWHGTACAGVAIGNADSKGIVGAAPGCRFMPVRWGLNLSDSEIERWFDWVGQQGASVVSCSWGAAAQVFRLSTRASRAISRCAREGRDGLGCVICFAAGNSSRDINDPGGQSHDGFAVHPDVIAVAASNSRDRRSSYSNFGNEISVCAPSSGAGGWGITTSDVMGRYLRNGVWREAGYSPGAFTHDFGGTSSACPLVAGICGLLLSIKPSLRATEVKQLLQRTARKIDDPGNYNSNGHSRFHGYGCVDALAAVKALR